MSYKPGNHWAICDRCGFKRYRSECRKTWDNLLVCADTCWEPRNPQDYLVKPRADRQYVSDPRPKEKTKATVVADAVEDITSTTAKCTLSVRHDGGSTVTDAGVCWSTSHAPTTDDAYDSSGSGMGDFDSLLSALTAGTTYYLRPYAVNGVGTAYGPEQEFTTLS